MPYGVVSNLNENTAFRNFGDENFLSKQMLDIRFYTIPKSYYFKVQENISKYAGFSYNYYTRYIGSLDSCVTYRTDKVITNSWKKIFYMYNSDHKVTELSTYHYKGLRSLPLRNDSINAYTGLIPSNFIPWVESLVFDSAGFIAIKDEVSHATDNFYKEEKEYYYYDENGLLTNYNHIASFEDPPLVWDTIARDRYVYSNPKPNIKITTILTWDNTNHVWANKKKTETTSNLLGQHILSIDSVWNTKTNSWQGYMKSETEYGPQNEVVTKTLYAYGPHSNRWIRQSKEEYGYYDNGDIEFINLYLVDYFSESWYLDERALYQYSGRPVLTGKSLITASNLQVYPNPATNWLTISPGQNVAGKYSIIDLNGRICKTGDCSNTAENVIDISDLDTGFYIVQIQINGIGNQVFKFVKQ